MKNQAVFGNARKACRDIIHFTNDQVVGILEQLAAETRRSIDHLIKENKKDLERMSVDDPKFDRLKPNRGYCCRHIKCQ